jgi:hypothetical protein
MGSRFGYLAAWHPGVVLRLGDVGLLERGQFTRMTTLGQLGIAYGGRTDAMLDALNHQSGTGVSVRVKLPGQAAAGTISADAAGVVIDFSERGAVVFAALGCRTISIENMASVGQAVEALRARGEWDGRWVIISEVVEAASGSVFISDSRTGRLELAVGGVLRASDTSLADASLQLTIAGRRDVSTAILTEHGMTPLYQAVRLAGVFDKRVERVRPVAVMTEQALERLSLDDLMGADEEEHLSEQEVQRIKSELWAQSEPVMAMAARSVDEEVIVAEGDSWFDYRPGLDILDHLKRDYRMKIVKLARAGDTLENMVYGTEVGVGFRHLPSQADYTLAELSRLRPGVLLLSGGGNDIAGHEFESFLNHTSARGAVLREKAVEAWMEEFARPAIEGYLERVRSVSPRTVVVMHGYARPIPDGRAVIEFLGMKFIGPWLRPALARKRIDFATGRAAVGQLIDRYNDLLADIARGNTKFRHVDLRDLVTPADWVNELHLSNLAYRRVAGRVAEVVRACLTERRLVRV